MKQIVILLIIACSITSAIAQPLQGDDYLKILGKRKSISKIEDLDNWIRDDYLNKGIRLLFSKTNVLTAIDFYNDENPYETDMKRFKGELPMGLTFEHTIYKAKKILGEGYNTEGDPSRGLMLIKEFPLNDVDGYAISMDFQKGRLTVVTIEFVEKGAVSSADAASAVKLGIKGDDYFTLMKKNLYHLKYKRLSQLMGAAYHTERLKMLYIKQGLGVYLSKNSSIEKMIFYSGGQACEERPGMNYGQYSIIMPLGIKFTDTKAIVIEKCGPPLAYEDGAMVYTQGLGKLLVYFNGGKISKLVLVVNKEEEKFLKDKLAAEKEKSKTKPKPISKPNNK